MRRGSVRLKQRKLARAEQLISLLLNLYAIPSVPALGLKRDYNILMRGWLIMAMVGAALMTAPAVAQVRAAHSASARASHPFPARSAFVSHSLGFVPPVANRPLFFHHHRYFVRYSRGPYYPGYYGGYSYPLFWDSYSGSDAAASEYDQQNYQLQQEVNQLGTEVQRLQGSQSSGSPLQPTTLVFRDGKKEQVQNYAIVGKTLWVFDERRTRKILLSELDVPATQKVNEERGGDFSVPQ
jgi:hypothetical protein